MSYSDAGLCFTFEKSGSCSLEVPGLYISKDVCCSTIGVAWGTAKDCELCSDFKSQCDTGFVKEKGKCIGKLNLRIMTPNS